ncbi:MAG: RelA/SpoT family protein, partial [Zoogloeaceae bacterium]|nr:RelA/SpoT family protein [Zoogloeaceae bacterium]
MSDPAGSATAPVSPAVPEDASPRLAPLWLGPIAPDVADRATFPFSKDPEAYYYDLPPNDPAYQSFLAELSYLPPEDIARIKLAVRFSDWAHRGQMRASGEPYVTHPLCVAGGIAEWRLDGDTVCAALLHDVLEDTYIAKRELARHFGQGVADLVDGLTKLDKLQFHSHLEAQASNFRKMLLATARDIRVILIKLADRLHNLRTMAAMRPDKRRRIAEETLEIYAPIANRLGLYKVFRALQDISFTLIHPWRAQTLTRAVDAVCGDRRGFFHQIEEAIGQKMQKEGIDATVFGREKGLYSIYLKMRRKLKDNESQPFKRIYDLYGFRVIVHEERDCYLALGALHALYKPREGRFKDYIANEKSNGYRSLHTTLTGPGGTPLEIQIRTEEMDHVAQTGIASHLLYKDGASDEDLRLKTHKWLQSLLEMQDEDAVEFFENVKIDLFPDEVYVFTPQGEIKALPQGATPIDMAYAIHTDVGNHCAAARINHEAASLRMELQNGDVVEIITSPDADPDPSWIAYART